MIDINTLIQQALEKAINDALDTRLAAIDTMARDAMQRINRIENRLDFVTKVQDRVDYCVKEIEDLKSALLNSTANLSSRINEIPYSNSTRLRLDRVEETLSGMQERFALKEDVEAVLDKCVTQENAAEWVRAVDKLERRVNVIDSATAENDEQLAQDVKQILRDLLDDDEDNIIASAVAQAFENGALTISVDKV